MKRVLGSAVALLGTVLLAVAADESQQRKSDEPGEFDIEPPILKQNLSNEPLSSKASAEAEVARLEKQFQLAKQIAASAARLYKIGVLSKAEMEQRLLKVIQCECNLAIARLAFCEEQIAALQSLVASGENAKDELAQARADLAQLTEAAEIASAKRERAELEAAELNLRRQQKLLKLGVARESDVTRAEEKLAELRSQKN
jgi:multidrug resistance efflux pump